MATPPLIAQLGQAAPAANTTVTLYTVPADRRAVISSLVVAETGGTLTTFRVHIGKNGDAPVAGNAAFYETEIDMNTHAGICEGWTLAAGDKVYVRSVSGNVTFLLNGEETDVPA